ncbi:PP2C family protein-serine/threonine phosphatase [Kitasatospora sp. NPDC059327]|uniref:PP2C family protein-serine/threonine phosphatase n=1 Tax=Kitasatospora sp. NPDC059327 TaxID=3346803 RepID=UPI0036C96897
MDDVGVGRAVAGLLRASQRIGPGELAAAVRAAARAMGLTDAVVLLADVRQVQLAPLEPPASDTVGAPGEPSADADAPTDPGPHRSPDPSAVGRPERGALPLEGSPAGRAYRTGTAQSTAADQGTGRVLWLPMVNGAERIGVLRLDVPPGRSVDVEECLTLAGVAALIVVAKLSSVDDLVDTVRVVPMTLQAELAWAFMPPRTVGTRHVTSTAVLEPAYEIGGDAFDHSFSGDRLRIVVVDAMGHDLASGGSSALAIAACRAVRRAGGGLVDIATVIDRELDQWFPERLLTGIFAELDTSDGRLAWVNRGHPAPLLIRGRQVVPGALERTPELPLGLAGYERVSTTVHEVRLEPGDRVLIHTDGVTEARSATGELFGEARLTDMIVRATAAGEAAPEALRRLVHALLERQDHRLSDDATIVLVEWHPDR